MRSPRRAARSHGFGIHSPFAFRFVREVLGQRYAYYCYPDLESAARNEKMASSAIKALFRVALWAGPGNLHIIGATNGAIDAAMSAANAPQLKTTDAQPLCVAALGPHAPEVAALWEASPRGMLFHAREMTVFVNSDRLPHQSFDIILP